ncbi:hypothetical protein DSUL_100094 [Desulfovibrionales bacterium]
MVKNENCRWRSFVQVLICKPELVEHWHIVWLAPLARP